MPRYTSNDSTPQTAYVWTKFDLSECLRLRESLCSAPRLPGLVVCPYYDSNTGTTFFKLSFAASRCMKRELRVWASIEGLNLAMPSQWSASRHLLFASELRRFRCGDHGTAEHAAITRLARQFEQLVGRGIAAERAASGMLRAAVPNTVELSPSMQCAVSAYLQSLSSREDAAPVPMEITESMIVDVRNLSGPVTMTMTAVSM